MKHRIVVLGAGYAGSYVAGTLARRLSPADTEITVVNAEPDFVQRLRLHQLAAGREIDAPQLADVFAGTGCGCAWPVSPPSTPSARSSPWPTPTAGTIWATTHLSTRSAATVPTTVSPVRPSTVSTSPAGLRRCVCASAWTGRAKAVVYWSSATG